MSSHPNFGVESIDQLGKVTYYATQREASEAGYCQQSISECVRGKRERHRKLRWRTSDAYGRLAGFVAGDYQRRPIGSAATRESIYAAYRESLPVSWRRYVTSHGVDSRLHGNWYLKPTALRASLNSAAKSQKPARRTEKALSK